MVARLGLGSGSQQNGDTGKVLGSSPSANRAERDRTFFRKVSPLLLTLFGQFHFPFVFQIKGLSRFVKCRRSSALELTTRTFAKVQVSVRFRLSSHSLSRAYAAPFSILFS